jgi:hypothetical protein
MGLECSDELSRQGKTDEALALAEEAKRAGLEFDAFTRKGLGQGPASLILSMATAAEGEGEGEGKAGRARQRDEGGLAWEEGREREEEGGAVIVLVGVSV